MSKSEKKRQQRTLKNYVKSSNDLIYELKMFFDVVEVIKIIHSELIESPVREVIKNTIVESFAIHLRNILHFLYAENPKPSDLNANDFVLDEEIWKKTCSVAPDGLEKYIIRANTEVAHLSYERIKVSVATKSWPFDEIVLKLRQPLIEFGRHVDESKVYDTFRDDLTKLLLRYLGGKI